MTVEELQELEGILTKPKFEQNPLFRAFVAKAEVAPKTPPQASTEPVKRTSAQHRALFLWYGMIEKICENEGVTWDRLIKHTHQLKVTKDNLHEAGKQLQKALFGKTSTKDLEKDQIDTLINHFADWFGKEELELPPFPEDKKKAGNTDMELARYENT